MQNQIATLSDTEIDTVSGGSDLTQDLTQNDIKQKARMAEMGVKLQDFTLKTPKIAPGALSLSQIIANIHEAQRAMSAQVRSEQIGRLSGQPVQSGLKWGSF